MNDEMRVRIENIRPADGELRSAWFTLPVYEEELEEVLGMDADSKEYCIMEKSSFFSRTSRVPLESTEKVDNTAYIWYNVYIKYRWCFL